jgi:hypothetical protein
VLTALCCLGPLGDRGLATTSESRCVAEGNARDRDDLATVRAAMETACPCASFDGSPGRRHRDYRRCTRDIIRDALATGALRRPCQRLLRRSTCGRPGRVVCCRERRAKGTGTCLVRRPARCIDTRRASRTVVAVPSCADTECPAVFTTTSSTTTVTTTSTSTTTLPPSFAAIYAATIGPRCGFCHGVGGDGGLEGLHTCATAHASLVDVPSAALPSRDLVEPGAPALSWLLQKLDGTQGAFDGQCVGSSCGERMPLGETPLDADVLDAIRTWVLDGAADDCP